MLRDADGRGADPLEPFYFLDGIDVGNFDRFLERCFGDGTWQNTFGVGAGTRSFVTSIGCPHRCIFCTSNPGWRRTGRKLYRPIPLPRLKHWAYLLRTVFGARKLIVLDEMVNVRTDFEAMLRMLNELDFTYDFPNGMRADHLSREAIALMKGRVGMLSISAESATQEDLNGPIGKGQPLEAIHRVAEWCRELDVPLMSSLHHRLSLGDAGARHRHARDGVGAVRPLRGVAVDAVRDPDSRHRAARAVRVHGARSRPKASTSRTARSSSTAPASIRPAVPPGYLEKARAAFDMKIAAREARKLIMNITYKCANRCVFCATGDRVSAALGWDKIEEILRQHRDEGTDQLDIDGGEPTTHPRLADAIGLARELGYRSINLTTNGRLLRDRALAERLAEQRHHAPPDLAPRRHGRRARGGDGRAGQLRGDGRRHRQRHGAPAGRTWRPASTSRSSAPTSTISWRSPRSRWRRAFVQDQLPVHDARSAAPGRTWCPRSRRRRTR